jgi:hypothetical protein
VSALWILGGCGGGSPDRDASADAPLDTIEDLPPDLPPGPPIVVFAIDSDGDLGGRAGADAACEAERAMHTALDGMVAHALLCITGPNEIAGFPTAFGLPTNGPIESLNGTRLAASWGSFMGGLDTSLSSAGVLPIAVQFFTGCGRQVPPSGCVHRCEGFETNEAMPQACVGFANATDAEWMVNNIGPCATERPVLCIAAAPL